MTAVHGGRSTETPWLPLLLLAYALMVATYFVARTGGLLAETDTALLTESIRSVATSGSIFPAEGLVYANGYLYAAVSFALATFTGMELAQLQQVLYPVLSALLVVPAWILYRELSGSARTAGIAALLLFMQPEFLFVVLRGSHERALRLLMIAALWFLARSFRHRGAPLTFASHVIAFYLVAFGLMSTNAFFGASFLAAVGVAFGGAWIAGKQRWLGDRLESLRLVATRLSTVVVGVAAIFYMVVFYAYPPAGRALDQFGALAKRTAQLVLTTESVTNPYGQVVEGWTSHQVYFLLALQDYVLMAVSAVVWLWLGVRRASAARRGISAQQDLAWFLYGALALQGAIAILADRTGMLGGNVQHRSFPSFAILAALMVAEALSRWRPGAISRWAGSVLLAAFSVLTLLKITNEPLLSNKWTFVTHVELTALEWAAQHVRTGPVWVGPDERLSSAALTAGLGGAPRIGQVRWDIYVPKEGTRAFLFTDTIRALSLRTRRALPDVSGANRIYDNGRAELYRLRASTPYER